MYSSIHATEVAAAWRGQLVEGAAAAGAAAAAVTETHTRIEAVEKEFPTIT